MGLKVLTQAQKKKKEYDKYFGPNKWHGHIRKVHILISKVKANV